VNLTGQVALVTGASRGIGRAIALKFAAAGADLILWATSAERLAAVQVEIEALNRRALAQVVRVEDASAVAGAVEAALKQFGRLDVVVNNAGLTRDSLLLRMKDEDWAQTLDVNLTGAFNVTRAVLRPMLKARAGRLINLTSVVGLTGNAGQANYAASKAGLIGFTKSVAKEVAARGLLVNAIAPGFIDTDMTAALPEELRTQLLQEIPLGRVGQADEIAEVALFLAASARYVTGQVLVVDGGLTM